MIARDLSALGHLEITWGDDARWSVAPPVLTLLPGAGRALLTGARTRFLYDPPAADAPAGDSGQGWLVEAVNDEYLFLDPWWQSAGPTTVTIAIENDADAQQLADHLGIRYTYAVGEQLARLLPPLAAYQRTWAAGELLTGFDAEMFDPASQFWDLTEDTTSPGLYQCRTWSRHMHALLTPTGQWFRVPREPAVYEILRWEGMNILRYDQAARELIVPGGAPLPLLPARAATLCSGRLPLRQREPDGSRILRYLNVPPSVAERIAASLGQSLQDA